MLRLCCEADIRLTCKGKRWIYLLHGAPCFGRFFSAPLNNNRDKVFEDLNITIYQILDPTVIKSSRNSLRVNNFCSLKEKDLEVFHKELEKVFSITRTENGDFVPIDLKITREVTTRIVRNYDSSEETEVRAVAINLKASKIVSYQLLVLLTLVRLSSEYPNALTLRHVCNLRKAGYFKELSILSGFMLACNVLPYYYDQGPLGYCSTSRQMVKPMCLEFFRSRLTPGTDEYISLNNKVINSFSIVDRGVKNIKAFPTPNYGGNGSISGQGSEGTIVNTNAEVDSILFEDAYIPAFLDRMKVAYEMVKYQFPKLKVDYPEFKE